MDRSSWPDCVSGESAAQDPRPTFWHPQVDRTLIFGGRQLVSVLAEYTDHDNVHRPHRALGQAPPLGSVESAVAVPAGRVVRRDRLGGLIHEYAQAA
jgi:putative transposase